MGSGGAFEHSIERFHLPGRLPSVTTTKNVITRAFAVVALVLVVVFPMNREWKTGITKRLTKIAHATAVTFALSSPKMKKIKAMQIGLKLAKLQSIMRIRCSILTAAPALVLISVTILALASVALISWLVWALLFDFVSSADRCWHSFEGTVPRLRL